MNLSALTDVDPEKPDSVREFLDANALQHETIYNTLLGVNFIAISHFPLWAPEGPDQDFLIAHDTEHRAISVALGLPLPVDLDQVDLNDSTSAQDWITNHSLAHERINAALGL